MFILSMHGRFSTVALATPLALVIASSSALALPAAGPPASQTGSRIEQSLGVREYMIAKEMPFNRPLEPAQLQSKAV